jgi:hypothetical protein
MHSTKFYKLKDVAKETALGNGRQKKHVSLIIVRNRIISIGTNQHKSHPRARQIGYRYDEVHSELDALIRCKERKNLVLVNFRFNRFGEMRISRPCDLCTPWCKMIFDRIYYSTRTGFEKLEY